jgi:hypothetical protein
MVLFLVLQHHFHSLSLWLLVSVWYHSFWSNLYSCLTHTAYYPLQSFAAEDAGCSERPPVADDSSGGASFLCSASSSVPFLSKMMTSSRESFQATAYSEDNTITAQEVNIISDHNEVDRPHHTEPSSTL